MKKMLCIVLALSMMVAFGTVAYAVGCMHENSVYDTSREAYDTYMDCGDFHEKVEWHPRICIDCGEQFWERDKFTYVEGHNLVLTYFDRNHNPDNTHAYNFECINCRHLIIMWRACSGPPCEVIYLPLKISELLKK